MPERNGKDQVEDSPKQACSCWFARHNSLLATSGANLYPPGVCCFCRCHIAFLWRYIFCFCFLCFVLFCFRIFASIESAALHSMVLRYACASTVARSYLTAVYVLVCFCFFGDVYFSEYYVSLSFLFCMGSTLYVTFSFRMIFFYLMTRG